MQSFGTRRMAGRSAAEGVVVQGVVQGVGEDVGGDVVDVVGEAVTADGRTTGKTWVVTTVRNKRAKNENAPSNLMAGRTLVCAESGALPLSRAQRRRKRRPMLHREQPFA